MAIEAERAVASSSMCGADLLAALADHGVHEAPLTVAGLAASTGRDRGLVARLADDLCELGLIERDAATRGLRLGWGLYAAAARLVDARFDSRGQQLAERLAVQCGEMVHVVRRRGSMSVTVAEAMPRASVRGVSWLGRSQPVVRADAGPILLMDLSPIELRTLLGDGPFPPSTGANAPSTMDALEQYIARARAEGVGILSDYVDAGTASVGAPIFDFRRRVVGAVVVVGAADRLSAAVDSLVDSVRAGADELSAALGWSPPSTVGSL